MGAVGGWARAGGGGSQGVAGLSRPVRPGDSGLGVVFPRISSDSSRRPQRKRGRADGSIDRREASQDGGGRDGRCWGRGEGLGVPPAQPQASLPPTSLGPPPGLPGRPGSGPRRPLLPVLPLRGAEPGQEGSRLKALPAHGALPGGVLVTEVEPSETRGLRSFSTHSGHGDRARRHAASPALTLRGCGAPCPPLGSHTPHGPRARGSRWKEAAREGRSRRKRRRLSGAGRPPESREVPPFPGTPTLWPPLCFLLRRNRSEVHTF